MCCLCLRPPELSTRAYSCCWIWWKCLLMRQTWAVCAFIILRVDNNSITIWKSAPVVLALLTYLVVSTVFFQTSGTRSHVLQGSDHRHGHSFCLYEKWSLRQTAFTAALGFFMPTRGRPLRLDRSVEAQFLSDFSPFLGSVASSVSFCLTWVSLWFICKYL